MEISLVSIDYLLLTSTGEGLLIFLLNNETNNVEISENFVGFYPITAYSGETFTCGRPQVKDY